VRQQTAVATGEIAMSDETEEPAAAPETPPEMVEVTIQLPPALVSHYDGEVQAGIYASRDEALRHSMVEGYRHHRGRYSTLRIDIRDPEDKRPDTEPEPPVDDLLAARDAAEDEG
jgi:Arc/MetJ-type ribon-helix-helix transcriptional regulator